jgi:hypothetical protein
LALRLPPDQSRRPFYQLLFSLLPGAYSLESGAAVLLQFLGPGGIQTAGTGMVNFQITSTAVPVPEPATWTLLLAGAGARRARRLPRRDVG